MKGALHDGCFLVRRNCNPLCVMKRPRSSQRTPRSQILSVPFTRPGLFEDGEEGRGGC
jgi:hypothetical protein